MNTILCSTIEHMKNEQDHFEVLRKIKTKPETTQMELADELGFSLGKLNYCLKALRAKIEINNKGITNNDYYSLVKLYLSTFL